MSAPTVGDRVRLPHDLTARVVAVWPDGVLRVRLECHDEHRDVDPADVEVIPPR